MGSYLFRTMYNPDGSVRSVALPPTGSLRGEAVVYDYDELGDPTTLSANEDIITDTLYSKVGNRVEETQYNLGGNTTRSYSTPEQGPAHAVAQVDQDSAGNLSTTLYLPGMEDS
ncbi:hypothetical protein BJF83_20465 [Nocardiopsis sp. CNR-923]|uniref:hypothetical protein n=1 Tax=Nocardiopsis sp. CNR-923 TaxID=1904965 RepID=UPI0009683E2E|nr:hypothetical protein [Nocardiopsis sp. CNR-923]OLT26655.1 hypothetical protein BJF83_20465 [Nocardiopsis sp. CNR-923]